MNVKKTKVVMFEAHKFVCQAFQYEGEAIEQLNSFKYLGVELHDFHWLNLPSCTPKFLVGPT